MLWTRALLGADLAPNTKLVGLALAVHARRAGALHVGASMTRVAAESGLPHREVLRAVEVLCASGWLEPLGTDGQPRPLDLATSHYLLRQPER